MGAPSVPPGRYFRMRLVGIYFEGIGERGLEWRFGLAFAAGRSCDWGAVIGLWTIPALSTEPHARAP